jgi:hypothetical protein
MCLAPLFDFGFWGRGGCLFRCYCFGLVVLEFELKALLWLFWRYSLTFAQTILDRSPPISASLVV